MIVNIACRVFNEMLVHTKIHVSLFSAKHVHVGDGYLGNFYCGDVLYTCALDEDEIAMYITNVIDGNFLVEEPFLTHSSKYKYIFIRWKVQRVQIVDNFLYKNDVVQQEQFKAFEWIEEIEIF